MPGSTSPHQNQPQLTHHLSSQSIVILGGGISGLAFARALTLFWPSRCSQELPEITIYEQSQRELQPGAEGYSISIRSDSQSGGIQALRDLKLLDTLIPKTVTGYDDDGTMHLWNKQWDVLMKIPVPKEPPDNLPVRHLRCKRDVLRETLIEGLPQNVRVEWGTGCKSVSRASDGSKFLLTLSNGKVVQTDILIAADGARSIVRRHLRPDDALRYAGVVSISATARFPSTDDVPSNVRHDWGLVLSGQGVAIFSAPVDKQSAVWSISRREGEAPGRTPKGKAAVESGALDQARELGKPFSEPWTKLLDATDPDTLMVFGAFDKDSVRHDADADTKVIYVGDANHAMSPFAGNGANMALMDAVDLAKALCESDSISEALKTFDAKSIPRCRNAVDSSRWVIKIAHMEGWWASIYALGFKMIGMIFRLIA